MAILHEYHCPTSLAEALRLIDAPDRRRHLLAGGTTLVGALETRAVRDVDGVVDLRRLGLDTMRVEEETIHIGAMTTLTDLATHPATRDLAGGLLPRAVRGEGPVNLRNQATVGGVIATAAYDSELYAALLALAADVMIHSRAGDVCRPLADLGPIDGIITEVRVARRDGRSGLARVARTPSDRPIVAAVTVLDDAGARTALCGVAARPVLDGTPLDPPDDVRGSAEYRLALAGIVRARAANEARETDQLP